MLHTSHLFKTNSIACQNSKVFASIVWFSHTASTLTHPYNNFSVGFPLASYPGRVGGEKYFSSPTRPGYEASFPLTHKFPSERSKLGLANSEAVGQIASHKVGKNLIHFVPHSLDHQILPKYDAKRKDT